MMTIGSETLERCAVDLDQRIVPEVEADLRRQWTTFCDTGVPTSLFVPRRTREAAPPATTWPEVSINQAQVDPNAMLIHQLAGCSGTIQGTAGALLAVRCNYGVGILPSLFGAEIRLMPQEQGNLPTSVPMGPERCRALLNRDRPDVREGLGASVLDTAEQFLELFAHHPNVGAHVALYHPDLQGPMDVLELLWGSDLFTAVYLEPDTIKALLDLITETYIAFMAAWDRLVPTADGHAVHWRLFHRGKIMLRDDSAMNFSPEHFDEFIAPWDQQLLSACGGGAMHFCGKGDHYIDHLCTLDNLFAVNMSQPELNDMERIYRATVDRGIRLLDLRRETAEAAMRAGRDLKGMVQCF